jgi:predicted dehydrogenase/nucleoside-diphosphate-sugar epimerase
MSSSTAVLDRPSATTPRVAPARPRDGQKVRIALVGAGAATRELHMPILAGHPGVEIAAVIDRDPTRAREIAAAYGVRTVLTDMAALTRDLADAAIVCTPPFHHAPAAIDLAGRGFHVLVEKPMATRHEDAERMVRAAADAGVALSVSVFRRLFPATRLMRALIDAELLGAPLSFDAEDGEVYNWPTATLGNMRKDLAGGGVLIDYGSHTFDRLVALFDGPGEVLDYRDNDRGGQVESDCEVRLRLQYKGRPIDGRVELSRSRNLRNSYRVRCERGTLELMSGERTKVRVIPDGVAAVDPQTGEPRAFEMHAGWAGEPEPHSFEGFRVLLNDWLDAIRTGAPPKLDGATVLPSLKIISDCYARTANRLPEPWVEEGLTPAAGVHTGTGKPKRVLITGATGFIGGRLAEVLALRDGWQVRALVHNPGRASRLCRLPVEMVVGELNGTTDAAKFVEGCDAVVHCAIGTSWGNRKEIFDVTVGGTKRLADAALAAGVGRFVHVSTFAVHDLSRPGVIDDTTPPAPPPGNDYAESKAEADREIQSAIGRGLCATTLRLANVYGPNSTIFTTRPLTHLMDGSLVLAGPAASIPCSTVYVDTVVEAMVRALAAPADRVKGELFTISEGDDLTWADFYGFFANAAGRPLRFVSDEEFARLNPPARRNPFGWALTPFREFGRVVTSPEMWGLTKRVLKAEPIYSAGKATLEAVPPLKRVVTKALGIDTPFVYQPEPVAAAEDFLFDLTRVEVRRTKAEQVLGLRSPVSRDRALALTLAWARAARVLPTGAQA